MKLTKEQFLARCANAYDAGLCTPERMRLLERWVDMVMRLEGGQTYIFAEMLELERKRLDGMYPQACLANDQDGYALIQFAAILTHHCQKCAVDPHAWWTRAAFCEHKKPYKTDIGCGDDGE